VGRVVIDKPAADISDVSEIQHAYLGGHRPRRTSPEQAGPAQDRPAARPVTSD
jgi:hypothetical protein